MADALRMWLSDLLLIPGETYLRWMAIGGVLVAVLAPARAAYLFIVKPKADLSITRGSRRWEINAQFFLMASLPVILAMVTGFPFYFYLCLVLAGVLFCLWLVLWTLRKLLFRRARKFLVAP